MRVYGVSVSYYTGKLEAYLRYKGIRYTMESPFHQAERVRAHAGAVQVPIVEREDGRWMSDSTPILAQLEREHPARPIMPADPAVRFVALLMEDHADEWLWRPAMHYRWSYEHDAALLSRILADEVGVFVHAPRWLKLRRTRRRQHTGFVLKDGVTDTTRAHVEQGYRKALADLTTLLAERPFLLGDTPSIADFGFMGPMLRHFGQDPTPAEIMRNEGPAVYEWVARTWNAAALDVTPTFVDAVPAAAAPMLKEIAETHLVQLAANAEAFAAGRSHFEMEVQGCRYRDLPVSRYRVWCLEQLREAFAALPADAQATVRSLLPHAEANVLWTDTQPAVSGYDEQREAPFNLAINVFADGVPR